jgi:hypothetical protein
MSKFAPCVQCQRHVRVGEGACPFCGSATGTLAARSFQAPHGAKRAILFALGTSLAAACSEPDDTGNQDTATTPTSPATSASAVPSQAPGASGSMTAIASTAAPSDTNVQAVYGAPVPSGSVTAVASTGPAIQPPYGVPPLPTETIGVQPVYGAPVPSDWVDQDGGAPVDAGEADGAAADGGDMKDEDAGAAPTLDPSSAVALYGAIPAP